jgi:DNA primase
LPGGELGVHHRNYLLKRNFDPDLMQSKYGFRGTGFSCFYKGQNFALSLIIPVYDKYGRLISFQARDVTGNAQIRYKGLKEESSIQHYKETLYNLQHAKADTVVLTEGIFDAIRGGDGFLCTFGTSLKTSQLRELSAFKKVYVLFDSEDAAQQKAFKYAKDLSSVGIEVENIRLNLGDRDVADLTELEVEQLKEELGI